MTVSTYPKTAADALSAWDRGEIVTTVEMGGLGPGYEQAIQVLVFEIIRDVGAAFNANDEAGFRRRVDVTVQRIDQACCGFSGAQVGAASSLAFRALRDGWAEMLESAKRQCGDDRLTMVSRAWPHVEQPRRESAG